MRENLFFGEGFIRAFKNKIYKYMTLISKNVYINELDDIVNKYNNTYQRTIKINPIDVKSNTCINSSKKINKEDPNFKIGDIVRMSIYKNTFAKAYVPNWSKEVFVITKVKNTIWWTFVISDLKVELSSPKKNISFNKNSLKVMKNAFYFMLKAFFVLKILKFLS